MAELLPANTDEMDALLFGGEIELQVPAVEISATRSLPPWEKM